MSFRVECEKPFSEANDRDFWQEKLNSDLEIAHLIIKPELVYQLISGGLEYSDLQNKMEAYVSRYGLSLSSAYWIKLSSQEVGIIYEREIHKGFVHKEVIESLLSNFTGHLFVFGKSAGLRMLAFKGRVNCLGRNKCYTDSGPDENDLRAAGIKFVGCDAVERVWGQGCGYRQELADLGILRPDLKYKNDTPFNGLHCSNPTDVYIAELIKVGVLDGNWRSRSMELKKIGSVTLPKRFWDAR